MLTGMLLCLVVGISDGDTLTARCLTGDAAHPHRQVKVRVAEIDAPESGQPFDRRSKGHFSALCFETEATIRQTATDRYGRMVARVQCRGVDANLEQVRAGMAWAFTNTRPTLRFRKRSRQHARQALACGRSQDKRRRGSSGSSPLPPCLMRLGASLARVAAGIG